MSDADPEAAGRTRDKPLTRLFSRKGRLRRLARRLIMVCVLLLALVSGGFLWFADQVSSLKAPEGVKADAIVVLTGGYLRIEQALGLLRDGAGKKLLISGAHPSTTRSQIRKITQAPAELFDCCVDIGYAAIDTIGNASEITRWIGANHYRSILVVTNNYHMLRSLHELRRADPNTRFIAYPVVNSDLTRKEWFREPDVVRIMVSEYGKYALASMRDLLGMEKGTGLRNTGEAQDVHTLKF